MNRKQRRDLLRNVRSASKHLAQMKKPYSDQVGERRRIAKEITRVSA